MSNAEFCLFSMTAQDGAYMRLFQRSRVVSSLTVCASPQTFLELPRLRSQRRGGTVYDPHFNIFSVQQSSQSNAKTSGSGLRPDANRTALLSSAIL